MNEGYLLPFAKTGGAVLIGHAVDQHPTCIRLVNAAKDFDQGRLASTILTQQRDNLTTANAQRHILKRIRAAKVLFDAVKKQT